MNSRPTVPLLACVALAAFMRLQLAEGTYLMNVDSPGYLVPAQSVNTVGLFGALASSGEPHPGYPVLVALLQRVVGDYEAAGLIIAVLFGSLAVLPIWAAARHYSPAAGWAAAILYAVHPHFVDAQSEIMTDSTSHFFIACALWGFARWVVEGRWSGLVITGVAIPLTWAVRLDGAIVAVSLVGAAALLPLLRAPWKRFGWGAPALVGITTLAVLPIAGAFLYVWGPQKLTPRILTPRPSAATTPDDRPTKYVQLKEAHGAVLGTARYLVHIGGTALFPLNAALLLVGLWVAARNPDARLFFVPAIIALIALIALVTGMVVLNYRMAPRYLATSTLAAFPLIGLGAMTIARRWGRAAFAAMALICVVPSIWGARRYDEQGVRESAVWLAAHREPDAKIYYAGEDRRFYWHCGIEARPIVTGIDHLETLARDRKVQAVVVSDAVEPSDALRRLLAKDDLIGPPRVFPDPPRQGTDATRVYPVRGTPLERAFAAP